MATIHSMTERINRAETELRELVIELAQTKPHNTEALAEAAYVLRNVTALRALVDASQPEPTPPPPMPRIEYGADGWTGKLPSGGIG